MSIKPVTDWRDHGAAEVLSCVVARSGQEPIVVNLAIASVDPPEEVYWVDSSHPHP